MNRAHESFYSSNGDNHPTTLKRHILSHPSDFILYLFNLSDGLQVIICFILKSYLISTSCTQSNKNSTYTNSTFYSSGIPLGIYIIIALFGWITKPFLTLFVDFYDVPWKFSGLTFHSDYSTFEKVPQKSWQRRSEWLFTSTILSGITTFLSGLSLSYKLPSQITLTLFCLCGIGLALCTAISESLIFTNLQFNSDSEIASGISLMMLSKVVSVAVSLGYITIFPNLITNDTVLMFTISIYTMILAKFLFKYLPKIYEQNFNLKMGAIKHLYQGHFNSSLFSLHRIKLWSSYIQQNNLILPCILIVVIFSIPDLRTLLIIFNIDDKEFSSYINTLLPTLIQLAKLIGISLFLFGLYKESCQLWINFASIFSIFLKLISFFVILFNIFNSNSTLNILSSYHLVIIDFLITNTVSELAFLSLLMVFCRQFPSQFETTSTSLILISSQSGSFLNKLDSAWLSFPPPSSTLSQSITLQSIWLFFYISSTFVLASITEPHNYNLVNSDSNWFNGNSHETSLLLKSSLQEGYFNKDRNLILKHNHQITSTPSKEILIENSIFRL